MFCDLVDSTSLSSQLDPEELREVVRAYQAASGEVIERFDGYIAQYLGDGLLVYFGYPQAHEDDAQRAVLAGLGILEAMTSRDPASGIELAVRVGIHTGRVVVGEIGGAGRHEQLALGQAPNVAARLQALAEPNSLLISGDTQRLIEGFFVSHDLGEKVLKGVLEPVTVFRIEGERHHGAFETIESDILTPVVGRRQEIRRLRQYWQRANGGAGQVVLLSGEAGIGKSRLVRVIKDHVLRDDGKRFEFRCSPYYQQSALFAVIDHLNRALGVPSDAPVERKLEQLEALVEPRAPQRDDWMPLFAALLSLPLPENHYPPLQLSAQKLGERTREALVEWLLCIAEKAPVLVVWEDLHWADPSTLELLELLIHHAASSRLLVVMTFRPDFSPPWPARPYLQEMDLDHLSATHVERMVAKLAGKRLPVSVVQQLVAKTDGVPLFVEELTKMVLESGLLREGEERYELSGPLPALAIPATLRDSLMARLDRLADVREVAQLGATLGRDFTYRLLREVSPMDETVLLRGLAQLVDAELIYRKGRPPEALYVFKHALIQDIAYNSLLRRTRQKYHQTIAETLELSFPETVDVQPELVAHHYTEAGRAEKAISFWRRAGEQAAQRSANVEAISHLSKGLDLLATLPESRDRLLRELSLRSTLNGALFANRGPAVPEVQAAFTRSLELCEQVGDSPERAHVQFGLFLFYNARAQLTNARDLADRLLRQAERTASSIPRTISYHAAGTCRFFLGEPTEAWRHLKSAIASFSDHRDDSPAREMVDIGVSSPSYGSLALWLGGHPDQALERAQYACQLARQLRQPFSLARALYWTSVLHQFRSEWQQALATSEESIALSSQLGFPLWEAGARTTRAWAMLVSEREGGSISEIRSGLEAWQQTATEVMKPHHLWLLAEALDNAGRVDEALQLLDQMDEHIAASGERWWQAEGHRLRGEILWSRGDHQEAMTWINQALSIARRQQARSLELRAAVSLARWQRHSHQSERAFEILAGVYDSFSEGFATADLRTARSLLGRRDSSGQAGKAIAAEPD